MTYADSLPERIRLKRIERGLSQENIADTLGISTTAYGDLERGRTEITVSRLESVALALGVSVAQLLNIGDTVTEIDWLRSENKRLIEENADLRFRLQQWKEKFSLWLSEALLRQNGTGQERPKIGF